MESTVEAGVQSEGHCRKPGKSWWQQFYMHMRDGPILGLCLRESLQVFADRLNLGRERKKRSQQRSKVC